MTKDDPWKALLAAPRLPASEVVRRDLPRTPGVYAWFKDDECVYVGMASVLRERLSKHLEIKLDLSRSTLRASVAARETGVTRAFARQRPSAMTQDQIDVVNAWIRGCDLAWVQCDSRDEADALERRLREAWMPPINLM